MRVLLTGATGFIGRALIPLLQRDGHAVVAWVRSQASARSQLGAEVELVPAEAGFDVLVRAMERCDAVVNLAGEPLMGGRWTAARRAILEDSRVKVTDLAGARDRGGQRRGQASSCRVAPWAITVTAAKKPLTEASASGRRFSRAACVARWEHAAQPAEGLGLRVVRLRTGVVLGRAGGALARMLPPFEFGLGGPIGSGKQYLPWIHLHDLVKIIAVALVDDRYRGPVNGVAPEQATSRSFARALGRALHRPAMLPLPALALRAIFGQAATVLLASQRVVPLALHGAPVRVRLSDAGGGARGYRHGRRHHDLARAVAARRGRRGALRAADQDGGGCAAGGDVRVLLESREPRPDHAGRHEVFHPRGRSRRWRPARRSTIASASVRCRCDGVRASRAGSRVEALSIFRRRARTASGGTSIRFTPTASARSWRIACYYAPPLGDPGPAGEPPLHRPQRSERYFSTEAT